MTHRGARRISTSVSRSKRPGKGLAFTIGSWMLLVFICVIAGRIVFSLGGKLLMLAYVAQEQRREIALLREETERLSQQNAVLREEKRRLNTPSGVILEARKRGYGFPGERLLVIEPPPGQTN